MKKILQNTTVALGLIAAIGHLTPNHALAATLSPTDQCGHVIVITADGHILATLSFGSDNGLTTASVNIMGDTDLGAEVAKLIGMQGFDLTGQDLTAGGDKTIDMFAVAYDDSNDLGQAAMILDALFGPVNTPQSLNVMFAPGAGGDLTDTDYLAKLVTAPLGTVHEMAVA